MGAHIEEYELKEFVGLETTYEEGRLHRRRRFLRTLLVMLYNGIFITFVTLVRLFQPFALVVKAYMASASIPAEVLHFGAQLKNLINKRKPWWLVGALGILLLGLCSTALLVDLFKFSVKAAAHASIVSKTVAMVGGKVAAAAATGLGALGGFAAVGPYIFGSALFCLGLLNAHRTHHKRIAYLKERDKGLVTPLKTFSLANKIIKTTGIFLFALAIAPFMFSWGGAIVTSVLLGVIAATALTLIGMKIAKFAIENHHWKKTVNDLNTAGENPFELLGMGPKEISTYNEKIQAKKEARFTDNVKKTIANMIDSLLGFLGNQKAKQRLEEAVRLENEKSPTRYLEALRDQQVDLIESRQDLTPEQKASQKTKLARVTELLAKPRAVEKYKELFNQWSPKTESLHVDKPLLEQGINKVRRQNGEEIELQEGLMPQQYSGLYYYKTRYVPNADASVICNNVLKVDAQDGREEVVSPTIHSFVRMQ